MLRHAGWVSLVLLLLVAARAWSEEPKPATKEKPAAKKKEPKKEKGPAFIRVSRDEKGKPLSMDTSIVTYKPADGTRDGLAVDLIGAVHIGDKAYYQALNKKFEEYDVLLYELVAPEGTRVPKGGGKPRLDHPISAMQGGMKSMLELDFQLEQVDYTKPNFVHADMSPDQFAKKMEERGEGFLQMFFKAMGNGMAQQGKNKNLNDVAILSALFAKDRAYQLKLILAEQFEDLESQMGIFDGPDGSTIITERNKKAFEVLEKEIKDGKKKIGVFYGAGHLADMEKRLFDDFKLKRDAENWVVAWDLKKAKEEKKPAKPEEEKKEEKPAEKKAA